MEIQFGERVGHGGWLIGPKLFRPQAFPAWASSKLCEFIQKLQMKMNLISICWNFSKISPLNINKWQRFSICPHVCGRTQRYQRQFGIPNIWRPLANSDESSKKFKFPTYMWICDPPEDPTVPMSQCPRGICHKTGFISLQRYSWKKMSQQCENALILILIFLWYFNL